MNYSFKGKGIFVFSDPAGANTVLALVDEQIRKGFIYAKDFWIFSDKTGFFSKDYDTLVERFDFSEHIAVQIIEKYKPTFLFSATSTNDFEHKWRKVAISLKLKTFSFIDHWTNYTERFTFNNETIWGDEIWVVNTKAQQEAIDAGIPAEKIKVVGNPYYAKVQHFIPKESKIEFYNRLGLDISKKTILFISDDIKRCFPSDEHGNCTLGFDEYTVLEDILEACIQLKSKIDWSNFQFAIKLHPREELSKFKNIIEKYKEINLNIISIQDCDSLTINYYSDYVLGMFSNMVIESELLNKKILRIQVGEKHDLLNSAAHTIFSSKKITQKEFLSEALMNLLNRGEGGSWESGVRNYF